MIEVFIAQNWKLKLLRHPSEESFSIYEDNKIFSVADGITRDPMPYLKDGLIGKLQFAFNYPKPSPAKKASDIFCTTFPFVLKDFDDKNENAVKAAFKEANKKIKKWNLENIPKPDYVMNDLAGCVASGVVEQDGIIYWGYLTDCGVAIFDDKGNLRFRTEDESPHRLDKYIWQDPQIKGKSWNQPKVRARIRSHYRNNPDEGHYYGALTGEAYAMNYVRTGTQEIKPNDHLVVYSDGLEPIVFSGEFSDKIRQNDIRGIERLCKKRVKTEGTLIISKSKSF